jgi:hypothetical protein
VGCWNDAHIVATHPALDGLTDANLSNWSCSVHEAFDSVPSGFLTLAIAEGAGPSQTTFPDGSVGTPYILARGEGLEPVGEDDRFMTGGGNISSGKGKGASRQTWGFEIRCDESQGNFQFNDHSTGDKFHLESITSVECSDDNSLDPGKPDATFDTLTLVGEGRLNGESGKSITVTLTDDGEPGKGVDSIDLDIDGSITLVGTLTGGNHQAHE